MKDKNPLISIIIPVYNTEKYIAQCLDSVINQTYNNTEIIVVNDGSKDNSLDIIKKIAENENRIKILEQSNHGVSYARNNGIFNSTGEFIMFVDSDDWINTELVQELWKEFDNGVDLSLCSYSREYSTRSIPRKLNINGTIEGYSYQRRLLGLTKKELADPSQIDTLVIPCAKLYKAEIIKKNKIDFVSVKEIGTEDLLFNLQYANHVKKVKIIDKPLYYYRRDNETSQTSQYKSHLFEQWKTLYSIIHILLEDKDLEFQEAYYNRVSLSIIGLGINELSSNKSRGQILQRLNHILNDPLYLKANKQLITKFFPLHWRIFFILVKKRNILGVYCMLKGITFAVNRNK